MKCLVLAGGFGNSLWPISRKNYPKQFMNIKENRSLFQETIARNISYCEEFLIVTNKKYHFIVEGQMKAFQGLKYRCFLEEEARKTAPAIAMACMCCNPSDFILVVPSDQIIEGNSYKNAILDAQELARNGHLVTFGIEATTPNTSYGYIRHEGENVLNFKEKPDLQSATGFLESGEYLWNSGMLLFKVEDFLQELKVTEPNIYSACKNNIGKITRLNSVITFPEEVMGNIEARSIENAVFEKSSNLKVINASFKWVDIGDLTMLSSYLSENDSKDIIKNNCNNVTMINHSDKKLVVANGLEDTIVVNTEDAIYISKKDDTNQIKKIIRENEERYHTYFEDNTLLYRQWGTYEVINHENGFKVKKINVYPGSMLTLHKHSQRSEHWSIVKGTATIKLGEEVRNYHTNESCYVPIGVPHQVSNMTEDELIIIEVSIGDYVTESDLITIDDNDRSVRSNSDNSYRNDIIKLEPTFKDYLWGGTKLKDLFHKKCDYDIVAESWELSTHEAGQSTIAEGRYKGLLFGEYLKIIGKEALGWKCQAFEKFPILIKFIDAKQSLSIQVHPDDEYALKEENEYGKNEMWYIMDCEKDAYLYQGFNRDISKEELKERIENNNLLEVLNKIEVKKGDTFFVEAGTIHAIGAGILICEIQQNSNATYRLYDYDRRDKFGNARELHLDKSLAVACLNQNSNEKAYTDSVIKNYGAREQLLGQCKYFECIRYDVLTKVEIDVDDTSFISIIVLDGEGNVELNDKNVEFKKGESLFIPAGKKRVCVKGMCTFILTHI